MDERLGRYRLFKLLAAGGMGEVLLARSEGPARVTRTVVVKRILRHLAAQPAFIEMFLNEARLAVPMSHPNIVQIFEIGEVKGTYFIVMEYVHGLSLQAIRRGLRDAGERMPSLVAAHLASQALRGLEYAHTLKGPTGWSMGLVHRDISPDNLLVGFDGVLKIVDFGIAKANASVRTHSSGALKGKYSFMSPEQIESKPLDGRADLFAVGVVLYQLLSGQVPFRGPSDAAVLNAILRDIPVDIRELNPEVPAPLAGIIERALHKNPDDRFRSAAEMASALDLLLAKAEPPVTGASVARFLREKFPEESDQAMPRPDMDGEGATPVAPSEAVTNVEVPPAGTVDPAATPAAAPTPIVDVPRPLTPVPGKVERVVLARIERPFVPDAQKRTRVPLTLRVDAFRPLMSIEVTREFEREFAAPLSMEEYSPVEANRAIDFLATRCLAHMALSHARRWAGRGFLLRYRQNLLGRVLLAAMPFLGPERLLQRSPREFSATTNYGTRTVYRVGPGHCQYEFVDELNYPEFIEGIIWTGAEISGATGVNITALRTGPRTFVFDITWHVDEKRGLIRSGARSRANA